MADAPKQAARVQDPPKRLFFSIRWIVACAAAVLTTLVVLGVTAVLERRTRSVLVDEIETRLLVESRNLALASSRALLTDYPELLLAPLVKEMHRGQPELTFLAVVDRSGIIQGHPDVREIGGRFVPPADLRPVETGVERGKEESLVGNASMLLVSVPILDPNGRVLGHAFVGLARRHIEEAVSRVSRQQYLILAAFLLCGVCVSFALMSVLLRPIEALRAGIERIGRGELGTPVKLASGTEFGLLARAINEMSTALSKAQGEMVERARLSKEMDLAREIQRSLLPSKQTVAGPFVIEGEQWAAAEVGGDYYDVLPLPDGRIALAMADVSGKGLGGCLVTSMLFSLLRAYYTQHTSPSALLAELDERLGATLKRGNFVTMFYGVLEPESGRVVYSSAGHNPTLVYRASDGRTEWFRAKGIPLGAIRGGAVRRSLQDYALVLGPGDALVQFTDGINETMKPMTEEQFGFERMEEVLKGTAAQGARAVLGRFHEAVESWRESGAPDDDETVLVVSREGVAALPLAGTAPPAAAARTDGRDTPSARDLEGVLRRFAEAERRGGGICLPATVDSMENIGGWLRNAGVLGDGSEQASTILNLLLYEVCINIAEHGCGGDPTYTIDLFWTGTSGRAGTFLIRDQGKPFRPENRAPVDLNDPKTRKRGRGFGLEIIHRAAARVAYYPGTERGNLTVLEWDPTKVDARPGGAEVEKEPRHA